MLSFLENLYYIKSDVIDFVVIVNIFGNGKEVDSVRNNTKVPSSNVLYLNMFSTEMTCQTEVGISRRLGARIRICNKNSLL